MLTDIEQNVVVRILIDHFILNDIKMDAKVMTAVAQAITFVFPNENECTYFIARSGKKNASGKLYDRYYNEKHRRKAMDSNSSKKFKSAVQSTVEKPDLNITECNDFMSNKNWLVHNIPTNLKQIWKETSENRLKENKTSLDEFLKAWPRYKDPYGFELIDVDFETMHPGKKIFIA